MKPLSNSSNRHKYISPTVAAGGGAISTTTGDSTLFRESLMLPCLATQIKLGLSSTVSKEEALAYRRKGGKAQPVSIFTDF